MNRIVNEFVNYVVSDNCPQNDKAKVKKAIQDKFSLILDRSVFYCKHFAVRISYTKTKSFSNTVLSLSNLQKYDHIPFFVVLVSGVDSNKVFLANTTFLSKISHSSQQLSMTNIKGSFNGSDIIRTYHNLENNAKNFEKLFAFHQGFTWEDNLQRLVDATSDIVPTGKKFEITSEIRNKIYKSVERAQKFIESENFSVLNKDLDSRVKKCSDSILVASRIENVNIRGRLIEALVTSSDEERKVLMQKLAREESNLPVYDTKNGLGDYHVKFSNGDTYTDIKTKVIYLGSNPKAYNIDKFLETMAEENTVFFIYLIGIDETGIMNTVLCSVYHDDLTETTVKQFHWAGRKSRGVTQFVGETLDKILKQKNFNNKITVQKAKRFIDSLIEQVEEPIMEKGCQPFTQKSLQGLLLNFKNDKLGFPNQIADDNALNLVLTNAENYKFAEERRLFYVAITITRNRTFVLTDNKNPSPFFKEFSESNSVCFIGIKKVETTAQTQCPLCKSGTLYKVSHEGKYFVGCSNFPRCKYSLRDATILLNPKKCPSCGGFLVKRKGKNNHWFVGCTNYPYCEYTEQIQKDKNGKWL